MKSGCQTRNIYSERAEEVGRGGNRPPGENIFTVIEIEKAGVIHSWRM